MSATFKFGYRLSISDWSGHSSYTKKVDALATGRHRSGGGVLSLWHSWHISGFSALDWNSILHTNVDAMLCWIYMSSLSLDVSSGVPQQGTGPLSFTVLRIGANPGLWDNRSICVSMSDTISSLLFVGFDSCVWICGITTQQKLHQ